MILSLVEGVVGPDEFNVTPFNSKINNRSSGGHGGLFYAIID
jgi:hypothetical protein